MLKKQIIAAGLMSALVLSSTPAKAGWPVFDVAKVASLVSILAGRYQPIAQVLSRINQVKTIQGQIESQAKAVMSGDIKALGQLAGKTLQKDAFTSKKSEKIEEVAEKGASATEVSNVAWDTYYFKPDYNPSQSEITAKNEIRKTLQNKIKSAYLSKSLFYANNSQTIAQERLKKIENALTNSNTMQDAVNANTLAVMANNFERLNQISMLIAQMQQTTVSQMMKTPYNRYKKPVPPEFDAETVREMGDLNVKDEIDVDLQ